MAAKMTEIRWHGRGGQGAKTAAIFLAEAVMERGKYSQGFPEYGPERRGAPVRGYTRISDDPIRVHCSIAEPKYIIVLDSSLLDSAAAGVADRRRPPREALAKDLRGAQLGLEIGRGIESSGHSGYVHVTIHQARKNRLPLNINDSAIRRERHALDGADGGDGRVLHEESRWIQSGSPRAVNDSSIGQGSEHQYTPSRRSTSRMSS